MEIGNVLLEGRFVESLSQQNALPEVTLSFLNTIFLLSWVFCKIHATKTNVCAYSIIRGITKTLGVPMPGVSP